MIIDLNKVTEKPTYIDEVVSFDENYLAHSEIRKLDNIHVTGYLKLNYEENVVYNFEIEGIMILPDCYTLEDYPYEFKASVEEIVEENDNFYDKLKNTLDIMEILWQNIVLEVPIRVGHDNHEAKSGEGWELVDGNTKKIDPRLAPLQELLKDKKEV